jgi:hypothetical protein
MPLILMSFSYSRGLSPLPEALNDIHYMRFGRKFRCQKARGLRARFVFLTAVTIEDCDVHVYRCSSLTSININQTTRRHIPEGSV